MIFCTSGWRTTSALVKRTNARPRTPASTRSASIRPLFWPRARSICVTSPVIDGLGAEADARQEHLHLLGRGVLRLVEDDERMVERAPAHVRERRQLDRAALEQLRRLVEAHQVVERVVERPQVRVDLLREVAGQEAQPLARLHRGPHEHDPLDRVALERVDGARDREIRLAGARGPDAEGDVVRLDVASGTRSGSACGRADRRGAYAAARTSASSPRAATAADAAPRVAISTSPSWMSSTDSGFSAAA